MGSGAYTQRGQEDIKLLEILGVVYFLLLKKLISKLKIGYNIRSIL